MGRIPPMRKFKSSMTSLARFWIVPQESDMFAASSANINAHFVNVTGKDLANGST